MDGKTFEIDEEFLRLVIDQPHYLGWLIGKDKLTPLHSEWIKYCWDSNQPRALQAFRGGYKSTAVDLVGCIRNFLINPNERVALIRKSFNDSATIFRAYTSSPESISSRIKKLGFNIQIFSNSFFFLSPPLIPSFISRCKKFFGIESFSHISFASLENLKISMCSLFFPIMQDVTFLHLLLLR